LLAVQQWKYYEKGLCTATVTRTARSKSLHCYHIVQPAGRQELKAARVVDPTVQLRDVLCFRQATYYFSLPYHDILRFLAHWRICPLRLLTTLGLTLSFTKTQLLDENARRLLANNKRGVAGVSTHVLRYDAEVGQLEVLDSVYAQLRRHNAFLLSRSDLARAKRVPAMEGLAVVSGYTQCCTSSICLPGCAHDLADLLLNGLVILSL